MATPLPGHTGRGSLAAGLALVMATALAYAAVGVAALLLAGPPGYASPLYPSAGVALAVVLVYGRRAVPGVWLGAFAVNVSLGLLQGQQGWALVNLPLLIGAGSALQAWVGAALVQRFVATPVVLNSPADLVRTGLLGAVVACLVSPSIAIPALLAGGVLGADQWASNWLTWWLGDTLGVLIATPLTLALIGRPAADWVPRRLTVGVPLLLALALLALAIVEVRSADQQRMQVAFERDANRLAHMAQTRLSDPVHALQALHSAALPRGELDQATLARASRWWLEQPMPLQAMGQSVRVPLSELAVFEARARADGLAGYRVFDRDEGRARAADGEVVALRLIEPLRGNAGALGVNALSIPAARAAILATRSSGEPAATAGFRLTQAADDDTDVVIYQALYAGEASSAAERQADFRGVVFVTVNAGRSLAGLVPPGQEYLQWCLTDDAPGVARPLLAGTPGCKAGGAKKLHLSRQLMLAGRPLQLQISADELALPGGQREVSWLLSTLGLTAAAMLGGLLLTVTGHSRRTELAVQAGTADLRHEIAVRASAEQALRESEQRLRSIVDHVPLGVMFLDPLGYLLECNPKLCEMFGRSAVDLRGRLVSDLVQGNAVATIRRLRRELLVEGAVTAAANVQILRADGQTLQVRALSTALRDDHGRVERMVAVLEDITEHLRLEVSERSLQQAQAASQAKSDFLSRMSHELRTPLNAMIGFAQLLAMQAGSELAPKQREWVDQIQNAGWHLLALINETLDLARIESGAVQLALVPMDLAPAIAGSRALVATSAEQGEVELVVAVDPDAQAVLGDATRIKQVLTNLLSNAIKYNRRGGRVMLSTRAPASGWVEIEVADTGMGMSEAQVQALFQPYNRLGRDHTDIEGTGIGLVISRRLAELMGGTLVARSRAGEGSTFTLRLPAARAVAGVETRSPRASSLPYPPCVVHYIEDNEVNVLIMQGVLAQRPQIELRVSALGLDGLSALRHERPDLILLDMHLPDISGLELLRHIKADDDLAPIPVIVVSADAMPAHIERALTMGARYYVTKPLELRPFLEIVDKVLTGGETRW